MNGHPSPSAIAANRGPSANGTATAARADASVVVLHAVVPGRVRVHAPYLYRDHAACAALAHALRERAGIHSVSPSALTGNVVILFERERSFDAIVALIRAQCKEAQRAAPPIGAHANTQVLFPAFSARTRRDSTRGGISEASSAQAQ
ncbi:MAG TPA: hypothetical protein VGZ01_03825, partial [Trinickia sp.]|nr:hypothetical protein [Trinickia sp.]